MYTSIKPLLAVAAIIFIAGFAYYSMFANEKKITATINKVEKIEKVNSYGTGKNFHVSTEVFYQVHTDKGMYRVYLNGFLAHPEFANLQEGKKYRLTVCGIRNRYLGWYRNVINAYPVEDENKR